MPSPYDEAASLFPSLSRYRKLIVAFLGTTAPFAIFLTSSAHTSAEIVAASVAYVLTNFGVYQLPNAPSTD